MANSNEIMKELDWLTDRISNQTRSLALGILALTWGLLIGGTQASLAVSGPYHGHLLFIGLLAILAMTFDFLQYVCGFRNATSLYRQMKSRGEQEGQYPRGFFYKSRERLFLAKQLVLGLAVIWLTVLILLAIA
ncbi:MAG: hypothetical protein HY316_08905 [Acidobacteria bacterium]|nr:hypothetical protein [Acidobacteriota bacterium]